MRKLIPLMLLFVVLGCGGSVVKSDANINDDDAAVYDGGVVFDADITVPDAGPDIIDAQPAGPNNRELTPAAGTVSGGVYSVDFQLGHWVSQKKMTGGNMTTEGAAAVKP